jgi:hypothetical protein
MDNLDPDRSYFYTYIALQKRVIRTEASTLQSTTLPETYRQSKFQDRN